MSFRHPHDGTPDFSWLRSTVDLIVAFIVAVILLRGFVLEGYLISTGSMAPGLLGFHKRTVCPSCGFSFAFGVSFDDSVDPSEMTATASDGTKKYASCSNCGQINIEVTEVPTSHGDQLLVQKHLYDVSPPNRWETVVFRNPASPQEAYVKRVVGLPGEQIQIVAGEILINGQLARKDYRTQCEMRIPVFDMGYLADSPLWEMPWELDDHWTIDAEYPASQEAAEMSFRPWRWFGGDQFVETPLAPADAQNDWDDFKSRLNRLPISWASRIEYDAAREVLRCEGVMSPELQNALIAQARNQRFRNAVYRLAALSHLCTVTDRYGYNAMVSSREYPVTDLMLSTDLAWQVPPEEIRVYVPIASSVFELVLNPQTGDAALHSSEVDLPLQAGKFPLLGQKDKSKQLKLEVSNFDRQLLVAINGEVCLMPFGVDPIEAESPESNGVTKETDPGGSLATARKDQSVEAMRSAVLREQQQRWRIRFSGAGVQVRQLRVFRDVYYTPGRRRNAVDEPFEVSENHYFVMGDNSPVSSDSRNWVDPCVPHKMLIGKPFLLHLPSRPAVLEFGNWHWPIRIPDWSRIRYIH